MNRMPLLPSHRASPHFGRYSFCVPLRVEGREAGYKPRWFTCLQMVTHPRTNRAWCRAVSFSRPTRPLSQAATQQPGIHSSSHQCFETVRSTTGSTPHVDSLLTFGRPSLTGVSWSLTSLFSTNMAISETSLTRVSLVSQAS